MGFRSTFVTEDCYVGIPEWFSEKWGAAILYGDEDGNKAFPIASAFEAKTYDKWVDLEEDLMRIIEEDDRLRKIVLVWLHECGGITRSEITAEEVKRTVPHQWERPCDHLYGHDYCRGCSDASKVEE